MRSPDPSILIPNLIVVVLVSYGILASGFRLESKRPIAPQLEKLVIEGEEIAARPWEDPLKVRERLRKDGADGDNPDPAGEQMKQIEDTKINAIFENLIRIQEVRDETALAEQIIRAIYKGLAANSPSNLPSTGDRAWSLVKSETHLHRALIDLWREMNNLSQSDRSFHVSQILFRILDHKKEVYGGKTENLFGQMTVADLFPGISGISPLPQLVLFVDVKGGFEAEAIEGRIRTRQAVFAAMGKAQYLPVDSNSMTALRVKIEEAIETKSCAPDETAGEAIFVQEDFVPREFVPRLNGYSHGVAAKPEIPLPNDEGSGSLRWTLGDIKRWDNRVRVIYLDRSEVRKLDRSQLKSVEPGFTRLLNHVRDDIRKKNRDYITRDLEPRTEVIGPVNSTHLLDVCATKSPGGGRDLPLVMYSSNSTVETDFLIARLEAAKGGAFFVEFHPWNSSKSSNDPKTRNEDFGRLEKECSKRYSNYILLEGMNGVIAIIHNPESPCLAPAKRTHIRMMTITDDIHARELVHELGRRGVDFSNHNDAIVLFSESDSIYGNVFPVSFKRQILIHQGLLEPTNTFPLDPKLEKTISVQSLSYLSGLDGRTALTNPSPVGDFEKAGGESAPLSMLKSKFGVPLLDHGDWRPWGTQQYDRIREAAKSVKALGKRVVAVGVVGSDPYDKLVVLQAIRPVFPEAHYFTTDLDRNMVMRENFPISRNLIVASPFGFSLETKAQGSALPFRDCYQTGVFHSVQRSIRFYFQHERWLSEEEKLPPGTTVAFEDSSSVARWRPNLFEIGRGEAHPLTASDFRSATPRWGANPNEVPEPGAASDRSSTTILWYVIMVVLILAVALGCALSRTSSSMEDRFADIPAPKLRASVKRRSPLPAKPEVPREIHMSPMRRVQRWWVIPTAGSIVSTLLMLVWLNYDEGYSFKLWFLVIPYMLTLGTVVIAAGCFLSSGGEKSLQRRGLFPSVLSILLLFLLAHAASHQPGGEPLVTGEDGVVAFLSGMSIWPSEVILLAGILFGSNYCFLAIRDFDRACGGACRLVSAFRASMENSTGMDAFSMTLGEWERVFKKGGAKKWGYSWRLFARISRHIVVSRERRIAWAINGKAPPKKGIANSNSLTTLKQAERFGNSVRNIGFTFGIALFSFYFTLHLCFGDGIIPGRCDISRSIHEINTMGWVALFCLLSGFGCARLLFGKACMVGVLRHVLFPEAKMMKDEDFLRFVEFSQVLVERFCLRLRRLASFPCLIVFTVVLAYYGGFDNWRFAAAPVILFVVCLSLLVIVYGLVIHSARKMQLRLQEELEERSLTARASLPAGTLETKQILSGRPFSFFFENPAIRAVLIPVGGGGFLAILDYLASL